MIVHSKKTSTYSEYRHSLTPTRQIIYFIWSRVFRVIFQSAWVAGACFSIAKLKFVPRLSDEFVPLVGYHKNSKLKVFLCHDSILEGVLNPNIHFIMFKNALNLKKNDADTLKTPVFLTTCRLKTHPCLIKIPLFLRFKSFLHYRTSQICFFSRLLNKLLLIEGLEDSIDVLRRNTNPRIIHFNVNLPFLIVIAARHRDASLMREPGSGVSKLHLESWKKTACWMSSAHMWGSSDLSWATCLYTVFLYISSAWYPKPVWHEFLHRKSGPVKLQPEWFPPKQPCPGQSRMNWPSFSPTPNGRNCIYWKL